MRPSRLSRQLRHGKGEYLGYRRRIVALSLLSAGAMSIIGLYQTGILRHLPEPPLPRFDADKVDASPEAYARFAVPDAFLGLGSYAASAALAAMGGKRRSRKNPLLPLALAGKAAFDAFQAGRLAWSQWARHRAFCSWCLLTTASTFTALALSLPEAGRAWKSLRSR